MIDPQMRPTLAAKARLRKDVRSGRYLLLYPERGMELNATGVEIVREGAARSARGRSVGSGGPGTAATGRGSRRR